MSREYGVWFEPDGGFVAAQLWSDAEAAHAIDLIVNQFPPDEQDARRADHRVRELCPDHRDDEQPRDECEICADDDERDDR